VQHRLTSLANVPKSLDQNDEVDPEPVTIRHADYENCSFRVVDNGVLLFAKEKPTLSVEEGGRINALRYRPTMGECDHG
jgi:hypothetical protein